MEFLDNAQALVCIAQRNSLKMSKKVRYYGITQIYNESLEMYNLLVMANNRNLYTDFEVREEYLRQALDKLECISSNLTILKKLPNNLTSGKWKHWGEVISKEIT